MGCCVDLDMRRYIVLLLITGIVWAQTDFDTLILKSGTAYFGEYSKLEEEIVYFKPHDTPTSPGFSNTVTVRRAQENARTLTNLCNGNPADSGFIATDCDSIDIFVLQAFVDLNNVTPDSCNSCDYDSNGIVDPVEMGLQEWAQGRLVQLEIGQHRGGFNLGIIPIQINSLSFLTNLYLSYNRISSIPATLWTMESLQSFWIANNEIVSVSDSIGMLINLEELGLYANSITSIPSTIGNLTNMRQLYIFDMELTTVPGTLWNLTALTRLDLDRNQLTEIDNGIGQLVNLEILWLSDNYFTELPDSLATLSNLSEVHIGYNYLYCVDGVQDISLIPDWLLNNTYGELDGLYWQNCSEMELVDENQIPRNFKLFSPYPNPFNPTTTIRFTVGNADMHSLRVFDITGRLVETLVNRELQAGEHEIVWNAGSRPSGVYFVRLESGEFDETQKVVLMK